MAGVSDSIGADLKHDEMVKVVAMLPCPSTVYKFRCLSKDWNEMFKPLSSQDTPNSRDLAAGFQVEVRKWCHKWETFCPILVSIKDIFGYHRATQSWKGIPSISTISRSHIVSRRMDAQLEGALLLASECDGFEAMYVANILTRASKLLPLCPRNPQNDSPCSNSSFCVRLLINTSLQTYTVIRFCRPCVTRDCPQCEDSLCGSVDGVRTSFVQVYDSQSGIWSPGNAITFPRQFRCRLNETVRSVYLDGMIYMLGDTSCHSSDDIVRYSIERGTFESLGNPLSEQVFKTSIRFCSNFPSARRSLVVCDDVLLMVITISSPTPFLIIWRIDLEAQQLSRIALSSPDIVKLDIVCSLFQQPVGHGNCVYIPVLYTDESVDIVTFDLALGQWSTFCVDAAVLEGKMRDRRNGRNEPAADTIGGSFNVLSFSFQPGLTPFMEV